MNKASPIKEPPPELIAQLQSALEFQKNKKFTEADTAYKKILKDFSSFPDAVHMAGIFYVQTGKTKYAITLLNKLSTKNPLNAGIHKTLGQAYLDDENIDQAEKHLKRAQEIIPDNAETLLALGTCAHRRARMDQALQLYLASLQLKRTHDGYIKTADLLLGMEKYDDACKLLEDAMKNGFDKADIRMRLGICYLNANEKEKCLNEMGNAFVKDPYNKDIRMQIGYVFAGGIVPEPNPIAQRMIHLCLLDMELDHHFFTAAWLEQLKSPESLDITEKAFETQTYEEFIAFFTPDHRRELLTPYFLTGIARLIVGRKRFERLITFMRRYYLENINSLKEEPVTLHLLLALAEHCFRVEYVYNVSPEENALLDALAADDAQQDIPGCLIFAAYRSLATSIAGQKLLTFEDGASPELQHIIKTQIKNSAEEDALKKTIKSVTPTRDSVSQKVKQQYEENPYPRWTTAGQFIPFHEKNISADLTAGETINVLIAGCGTGLQAVHVASTLPRARILAVDLSYSSLAYAIRQTKSMGLNNLEFMQGDILELAKLGKTFDHIACTGVLHHMDDPMAGWRVLTNLLKKDGLMKIALYSEIAREDIVAARALIKEKGFPPTPEGIRECRTYINALDLPDTHPLKKAAQRRDFFSMSACRDLVFHIQEHRFTIPMIRQALADLELNFAGFTFMTKRWGALYNKHFPHDPEKLDLNNWEVIENTYKDMFTSMYQFYVKK